MTERVSSRAAGFVLVNALVLVAALAGIAVLLLSRAEGARLRQFESQSAAQINLYLDAFEALTLSLLSADRSGGATDHLGETWARATYNVPLDRGRVEGRIIDLQGHFNINWLAQTSKPAIWESFHLLLRRLQLPPGLADEIAGFLAPGGPTDQGPYVRQEPGISLVGGPVLMLDQLLVIPGLDSEELERLRPFVTALPGDVTLNVNTAPAEVLQAMIPRMNAAAADRLVQSRRAAPFVSIEDFTQRMGDFGAPAALSEEDQARLGVGSTWFEARISASLEGRLRHRQAIFERRPLTEGVRIAYRLDRLP